MISELVLMGPSPAGKSTVGKLIAEKLSIPFVSLSSEAQEYKHWQEKGFDETVAKQIWDQDGDEGWLHHYQVRQPRHGHHD